MAKALQGTGQPVVRTEGSTPGWSYVVRDGSSDDAVLKEIVRQRTYEKKGVLEMEPGDTWLDLGANCGIFTIYALAKGAAHVVAVEPEPSNLDLLDRNLAANAAARESVTVVAAAATQEPMGRIPIYIPNSEYNNSFTSIVPVKGRQTIEVDTVLFDDLLAVHKPTGVKLDIEGAEHPMLDADHDWGNVRKLTMEYHFTGDSKKTALYWERMARLEAAGFTIYPKGRVKPEDYEWHYWPSGFIIQAVRTP